MHDGAYDHDLQMLNVRVTPGCYKNILLLTCNSTYSAGSVHMHPILYNFRVLFLASPTRFSETIDANS
jgi:hypothetical protein